MSAREDILSDIRSRRTRNETHPPPWHQPAAPTSLDPELQEALSAPPLAHASAPLAEGLAAVGATLLAAFAGAAADNYRGTSAPVWHQGFALIALAVNGAAAAKNGVEATPANGWSSRNPYEALSLIFI